ncbi:hypothetical protein ACF0H5_006170 [Mactra antiquata]
MKNTLCGLAIFVLINGIVSPNPKDDVITTGRRKNRLLQITKQLDDLVSLVEEMKKDKDKCCSTISDMNGDVRQLNNKINDLDSACIKADVDIAGEEGKHCDSKIQIDAPSDFHDCLDKVDHNRMSDIDANIWCLRVVLWRYVKPSNPDSDDLDILQEGDEEVPSRSKRNARFIRRRLAPRNITQPRTGFRIRKEYRALTLDERQRYHNALTTLYQDGTLECFALIHQMGIQRKGAHGGPAFLPWHRAFLSMYEEALRQVDPTVSLPYWDSSIDNNIEAGPGLSVIWDDEHFGQGTGIVDSGPFANWLTPTNPLRRDIARGVGSLIRQSKIDNVMQYGRLEEFDTRWELAHNNVHRWVGGTMSRSLSASDPIFYMHHAFIDYQWEQFRKRQLTDCAYLNIDPQYDYPHTTDEHHLPDTRMDGMRFLVNKDGIANFWTENWYQYEDRPSCSNNCSNSPDMFCDQARQLCVGHIRFDLRASSNKEMAIEEPRAEAMMIERPPPETEYVEEQQFDKEVCRIDPYTDGCPLGPQPRTNAARVQSMIIGEQAMPPGLSNMNQALRSEMTEAEDFPPESEPVFFQSAPDEPNDQRTMENGALNILTAAVEAKTTEAKSYAKDLEIVQPKM